MAASDLIRFKRGTSAALATIKSNKTGVDGAFYLTIDDINKSSRLYVGRSDGDVVPVNQGIFTVTNVSDLTASVNNGKLLPGDFAYVTGNANYVDPDTNQAAPYGDGNILAYWTGASWIQLNKVDVADKYLASLGVGITTSGGVATVTITGLDEQGTKGGTGDPLETTFTVQGANGITASNSGTAITLTGTSYDLGSAAVVTDSNEAIISLTSKDSASATATTVGSVTIESANGNHVHITGAADTIEIDAPVVATATLSNETNGFGLVVTDSFSNSTQKSTVDPVITIKTDTSGTTSSTHFVSGTAALDVYSTGVIDSLLKGLDALAYKGTVGTNGSYAQNIAGITANNMPALHIGDTFKLTGSFADEYQNIPIKTGQAGDPPVPTVSSTGVAHGGDLLIANGVEDANGEITTLYYDIIEVDKGEDTTYTLAADTSDNKLTLTDSHGTTTGSIAVSSSANNPMSISSTASGSNLTVLADHAQVNPNANLTNNKLNATTETAVTDVSTFTAVTDITVDKFGHATEYKTKQFTVKDMNLAAISESFGASASNNVATITATPSATNADSSTATATAGSFDLTSQNLTVTAPAVQNGNPQVMVNFVWESF